MADNQNQNADKHPDVNVPISKLSDGQLFDRYGKLPSKEELLHKQLKTRKYFDSGDFALSQASKSSDIGFTETGREHPLRQNISHPFCPVPDNSNVDKDANRPLSHRRGSGPGQGSAPTSLVVERAESGLHRRRDSDVHEGQIERHSGARDINDGGSMVAGDELPGEPPT